MATPGAAAPCAAASSGAGTRRSTTAPSMSTRAGAAPTTAGSRRGRGSPVRFIRKRGRTRINAELRGFG